MLGNSSGHDAWRRQAGRQARLIMLGFSAGCNDAGRRQVQANSAALSSDVG